MQGIPVGQQSAPIEQPESLERVLEEIAFNKFQSTYTRRRARAALLLRAGLSPRAVSRVVDAHQDTIIRLRDALEKDGINAVFHVNRGRRMCSTAYAVITTGIEAGLISPPSGRLRRNFLRLDVPAPTTRTLRRFVANAKISRSQQAY